MGTSYIPVARAEELAPGSMKPVDMGGRQVVVANVAGKYFAFARECPQWERKSAARTTAIVSI
jgi:nitrite reductase/ring-hydroxylating ferredoxin subunit